MPFELSLLGTAWMAAAIVVAAFIRGYSGFGYSAMVIAASSLVMNPLNMVAVVVILETAMSLQAARGIAQDVDWRRVWLLLLSFKKVGIPCWFSKRRIGLVVV